MTALRKEGLKRAKSTGMYTVGFTQKYALAVHETNRNYRVGGWKYFERPTRKLVNSGELALQIRTVAKKTGSITMGLKIAAFRLLREATLGRNDYIPIDTGALRASGYVGLGTGEKEAQAGFIKSEQVRQKALAARRRKK